MATLNAILAEFRAAIAAVATTRDPTVLFMEHSTDEAFESAPLAGADGFSVEYGDDELLAAFGLQGSRMKQARVLVKLGCAPYDVQAIREENLARDVERLADILESRAWNTAGVDAVFFEAPALVNKQNSQWWIAQLTFRVVYTGQVAA